MNELEMLYFEKELADIKDYCSRTPGCRLRYKGRVWYLYQNTVYDADMNVFIPEATNGFLDLYEYFEYFPQPKINKTKRSKS